MDQCLPEIAKSMAEIISRSTNEQFRMAALTKLGLGRVEEVPQRLLELMTEVAEKKKKKRKADDCLLWEE